MTVLATTPTITYDQLADILGVSENAVRQMIKNGMLNGCKGEIVCDSVFRAYLEKRGAWERYEQLSAEEVTEAAKAQADAEISTVRLWVKQCLSDLYLEFMPYYSEVYAGKKSQDDIRRMAQSAALAERFGNVRRLRHECIKAEVTPIRLEQVYDVLLDIGFAPYGIHSLNRVNLRNWFAKHKDGKSLVHKGLGNTNKAIFSKNDDIVGWALNAMISGYNYSAPHIRRILESRCALFGYQVPSVSWIKALRQDWEPTISEYMYDDRNPHTQKYRLYIPTMKAPYAGTVWTIDGTQYNIVPHMTQAGKQARLYYVALRDDFSGDILAVVPCYREDVDVYLAVVRHAIEMAGYLPYEIRHDRFPGHNTPEWQSFSAQLERAGVKMTPTSNALGKARHERMYETLQSVFDSFNKLSYRDSPLSTRKHGRVRATLIAKAEQSAKREGFNWQQAVSELIAMVSFYRNAPYSAWSTKYRTVFECKVSPKHGFCSYGFVAL